MEFGKGVLSTLSEGGLGKGRNKAHAVTQAETDWASFFVDGCWGLRGAVNGLIPFFPGGSQPVTSSAPLT